MIPAASSGKSGKQHQKGRQRQAPVELPRDLPPSQHSAQTGKPESGQEAGQKCRPPERVNNRRGVVATQATRRAGARCRGKVADLSDALENQRAIGPAKTEVVFDRKVNRRVTRGVGTKIQIALRILIEDVDGRRNFLVVQGQHGED